MTKEQWHHVRNMPEIPLYVWFEYYREKGGVIENLAEFESQFYHILLQQPLMIIGGKQVLVTFQTAVERLFDYYKNKFPDDD